MTPAVAVHAQDSPSAGSAALATGYGKSALISGSSAMAESDVGSNPFTVTAHFDVGKGKPLAQNTLTFSTDQASSVVLPCPRPPDSRHVFAGWYLQKQSGDGSGWSGWELRLTSETYSGQYEIKYSGKEIREFCREHEISGDITLRARYIKTVDVNDRSGSYLKKVNIAIKKWKLKSSVKASFEKASPVFAMDIKIGTALLAKAAKANLVIEVGTYTIIVFKGKKSADVYARASARPKKKTTKITLRFKYSSYSCQCNESYCRDVANAKAGYVGSMATLSRPNASPSHTVAMPFYGKAQPGMDVLKAGSSVTAPTISKKIKIVITRKSLSLKGKLQTGSPFYKKAKKMVGEYSASCNDTAMELVSRVVTRGWSSDSLLLPTDKAGSGDFLYQQGHISVYLGGGQSLHGSVSTHKTWIGSSNIRKVYYASRTYWSVFYCRKYR